MNIIHDNIYIHNKQPDNSLNEILLSHDITDELIKGIAIALQKLIYITNENYNNSFYSTIFDENITPISSTTNLFTENKIIQLNDIKIFINDISNLLSLTTSEIVTAYIYFEQIITTYGFNSISIFSLRPLIIACVSIVSRTLNHNCLTVIHISNILIEKNYKINPTQLATMENFVLQNLDYKLNHHSSVYINYINYINFLIYQVDHNTKLHNLAI